MALKRHLLTRRWALLSLFSVFLILTLYNALFSFSYSVGENYRNVSIDARVNITNAVPMIEAVRVDSPVTLNAGSTTLVYCNVSVLDYNGNGDINYTSAVLYSNASSSPGAADNNNTHYTNTNCTVAAQSGDYKNFSCNFTVYYYAVNGSWICNATTYDFHAFNDSEVNLTTINALLALNVTSLVDYGNLSVGDTSANQTLDVTNIGNRDINVSVKGYGLSPNDGLAFVCDQGNISIENEKYSVDIDALYAAKTPLSSTFTNITDLTITKQTDSVVVKTNTTYWQLYVPPNPFGVCNGTIVFQAENS